VSCRTTKTPFSPIVVFAFVGPRPVVSERARTTVREISAASSPPTCPSSPIIARRPSSSRRRYGWSAHARDSGNTAYAPASCDPTGLSKRRRRARIGARQVPAERSGERSLKSVGLVPECTPSRDQCKRATSTRPARPMRPRCSVRPGRGIGFGTNLVHFLPPP